MSKKFSDVQREYPTADSVLDEMKAVSKQMRELEEKNRYLHYANAAHLMGFAVGDTVMGKDLTEQFEVVRYDSGIFWGKPIGGRKTKLVPLYRQDGYTRLKRR